MSQQNPTHKRIHNQPLPPWINSCHSSSPSHCAPGQGLLQALLVTFWHAQGDSWIGGKAQGHHPEHLLSLQWTCRIPCLNCGGRDVSMSQHLENVKAIGFPEKTGSTPFGEGWRIAISLKSFLFFNIWAVVGFVNCKTQRILDDIRQEGYEPASR